VPLLENRRQKVKEVIVVFHLKRNVGSIKIFSNSLLKQQYKVLKPCKISVIWGEYSL
jgi:hypothetical protein